MTSIKPKPDEAALVAAIAKVLNGQRTQQGLTTAEMYGRAGVAKSTWDRLQRGETQDPSMIAITRLAAVVGLSFVEIIDKAEEHLARVVPDPRRPTSPQTKRTNPKE